MANKTHSPLTVDMAPCGDGEVPTQSRRPASRSWGTQIFYLFSLAVHVTAAVALSTSWVRHTSSPIETVAEATPNSDNTKVVRLAIDLAPVKYCEMDILKIVGVESVPAVGAQDTTPQSTGKPETNAPTNEPILGPALGAVGRTSVERTSVERLRMEQRRR